MPIIEDDIKVAMVSFLKDQGSTSVKVQLGTRQGYDVEGANPVTGRTLVIECKGEAKTGSQHSRSWPNVASAILTSLNELEDPLSSNEVAMAFPDTNEYRERMRLLQPFCKRQGIDVYWVSENKSVRKW